MQKKISPNAIDRSSLTQEIEPNIGQRRASIGEVLAKLIRPFSRPHWPGLTRVCSHAGQGCPKRSPNVWRSRGRYALRRRLHLSCVKRRVRRAATVIMLPHWLQAATVAPAALTCGGVLGEFWEVLGSLGAGQVQSEAHQWPRAPVALSMIAEARRRPELRDSPAPSEEALVVSLPLLPLLWFPLWPLWPL